MRPSHLKTLSSDRIVCQFNASQQYKTLKNDESTSWRQNETYAILAAANQQLPVNRACRITDCTRCPQRGTFVLVRTRCATSMVQSVRMASMTPDLLLDAQQHLCVNNLPRVLMWSWRTGSRTRDLLIMIIIIIKRQGFVTWSLIQQNGPSDQKKWAWSQV